MGFTEKVTEPTYIQGRKRKKKPADKICNYQDIERRKIK